MTTSTARPPSTVDDSIPNDGKKLDSSSFSSNVILQSQPLPADTPSTVSANPRIPSVSASAVLGESASMPEGTPICTGHDFNQSSRNNGEEGDSSVSSSSSSSGLLDSLMQSMRTTGFQATNLSMAVDRVNEMRQWRLSRVPWKDGDDADLRPPSVRSKIRARLFLGYTSNQISSGQREVIRFLVQHGMVDVVVTTAGGIEEDLIKTMSPTYMGDFKLSGRELRRKGINRIGNLLVPNKNYCQFEDWFEPIVSAMHDEQDERWDDWATRLMQWRKADIKAGKEGVDDEERPRKFVWTPSKIIERLGREINDESSVLYWAARNSIPIFCPALTDGSIGDMLYFHSYKRPGFVLDINEDIRRLNDLAVQSHATGMIILGGGLVKHHVCNANLMRNGADWSVYINTGQEFDGSDSGASPDEAISWGKIRTTAEPVKVCADATIVFPLIVSQTFAKDVEGWKERTKDCVCWLDN